MVVTLRADAARNRQAIVEAARAVFAEQGLDAPLDEIAKRAGTGNATLYRRFPQRADLVAAVFADRMAEHVAAVEAGLADDDPWRGFASYIEAVGAMQARDHGIAAQASARLIALLLDGLRAEAATAGPPPPPARHVMAAMRHNGERRLGCSSATKTDADPDRQGPLT